MIASKGQHILIVDDEKNIRFMLGTALRSVGYRISEATNGREALDSLEQEVPDVMILDLSMPQVDGMGVLQELKNLDLHRKPRIIVLTAYGSIPVAVKATRLGAMDFLEKPVSPDEVRESVEAVLAEPEPVLLPVLTSRDPLTGGLAALLDRARKALRSRSYADAELLLMKAADISGKDPAVFNLLGACSELQLKWRLARKYYGKAIAADSRYEPAQQNMRRMYELTEFGASKIDLDLGETEPDAQLAAGRRSN